MLLCPELKTVVNVPNCFVHYKFFFVFGVNLEVYDTEIAGSLKIYVALRMFLENSLRQRDWSTPPLVYFRLNDFELFG